ncbi:MAG: hypothetical protein JHC84_10275 [Solirubrobacteraceae bacterium]|nr:hypothetical protein [Solirubrobacteraceae bacterium]
MPSFCRHNRFIQNCPICKKELEPQPAARPRARSGSGTKRTSSGTRRTSGVQVRREVRAADDGYRNELVPGLKSSADARRLAEELAFSAARLAELATNPPVGYAAVAVADDPEQALWLAFLIAYLGPLEGDVAFAAIDGAATDWAAGELPDLGETKLGPRTSHDPARGDRTLTAYRAWAERSGGQVAGLAGEESWSPERRFSRAFERLGTLAGFARGPRFDLLVSLGRLGVLDLTAESLHYGEDQTSIGAKRVFGIADLFLMEKRSAELADATGVPLEALDLALHNWSRPPQGRATMGSQAVGDPDAVELIADELDA